MLLIFKFKTEKESFETLKFVFKIIRGTLMRLRKRNILVKVNVWVIFTITEFS